MLLAQKNAKGKKVYKVHWTTDGKVTGCDMAIAQDWQTWQGDPREYYRSDPEWHCSLCHRAMIYGRREYKEQIEDMQRESMRKDKVESRKGIQRSPMPDVEVRPERTGR